MHTSDTDFTEICLLLSLCPIICSDLTRHVSYFLPFACTVAPKGVFQGQSASSGDSGKSRLQSQCQHLSSVVVSPHHLALLSSLAVTIFVLRFTFLHTCGRFLYDCLLCLSPDLLACNSSAASDYHFHLFLVVKAQYNLYAIHISPRAHN